MFYQLNRINSRYFLNIDSMNMSLFFLSHDQLLYLMFCYIFSTFQR